MKDPLTYLEIQEAIMAGQETRQNLCHALTHLEKAQDWGIIDLLGGGLISTMLQQDKVDDAADYMDAASESLARFRAELGDINMDLDPAVELGDFLSAADYLFDNIFSDCIIQEEIDDASDRVEDAIYQIDHILEDLEQRLINREV